MPRILLLLEHKQNRRLLEESLHGRYELQIARSPEDLNQPLDLLLVDALSLDRHASAVSERKLREQPSFLPVLLLVARPDVRLVTRHLWKTVDELILTPIERLELAARIEILLRARRQSVQLRESAMLRMQTLNRTLRMIRDCNQALIRATDERELLADICRLTIDVGGYCCGWVALTDAPGQSLRPAVAAYRNESATHIDFDGKGPLVSCEPVWELARQALTSEETRVVPRLLDEPTWQAHRHELLQHRSAAAVALPLKTPDGPIGVLTLFATAPDAFGEEEIGLLEELAGDLAFGLSALRAREERRRFREAMEASERKYRLLFESANDAIFLMDREKFLECNSKTCELFGCQREDVIGHSPVEFSPPYQPDGRSSEQKTREMIDRAWSGRPLRFEWVHTRKDGTRFFAEVSLNRLDLPQATYLLAIVRDIDVRKKAELAIRQAKEELERRVQERTADLQAAKERAEEADRMKTAFLAMMSHELRTPLTAILGFSEVLLRGASGPLTREQAQQIGMIQGSARRLLSLINDLLDVSRIEAGRVDIRKERFRVSELLEQVVQTVRPLAARKKLQLTAHQADDVSTLISDRQRVEQILLNLLTNAVKFTETGQVRVECRKEPPWLVFRVSDTGIGIAPEDAQKIFEPFQRVESDRQKKREGIGLGLAICRRLVQLLSGEISVESELGKGSTFTVKLPLEE